MKKPQEKFLKNYKPPVYQVERIDLDVDLYNDHALVRSHLTVKRNKQMDVGDHPPLILDGRELELVSLHLNGVLLSSGEYTIHDETLSLSPVTESFVLDIVTRIRPRENTSLEGLYMAGENFLTQCEAEGFRRITYFPDRPDVMSRYSCAIRADKATCPVLLSNGNCIESRDLENNRHMARWEDPYPKPCYLFALVAGDFGRTTDTFLTAAGKTVTLEFYVDKGDEDKCTHAMNSLKKAMAWDEHVFGLSYDLDIYMIVATHAFNAGAMENKGLNIFNSKYVLAKPETATDTDFSLIEGVIGHEYFHNWTGNRVTLNSWFQLSLKEGLTVFRDQEFSSDMGSRAIKRISDVRTLRAGQFPEDAGPMAHPIRPESYIEMNNFYTSTVYNKGAEVIRMIHTLLGPEGFRKGMDLYFRRFDGKAVTTEDFVKAMEDASLMDLTQFRFWYSQAGTPKISVRREYDASSKTYSLTLGQKIPDTPGQIYKSPMLIPVKMALLDQAGNHLPLIMDDTKTTEPVYEKVLTLTDRYETFCFRQIDKEPTPSLFRGFSAPISMNATYCSEELMFLMAHESDDFNRWEAAQVLISETILQMVENKSKGNPSTLAPELIRAFEKTLTDTTADKALIAQIMTIASESELGDRMNQIDVDGIHEARDCFINTLAKALHSEFRSIVDENREISPYSIDSKAMARRKLKNLALSYLARSEANSAEFMFHEFNAATNMTDELSALSILSEMNHELKKDALNRFYEKWNTDTLVLDKWFGVQAASSCNDTF